MKIRPIVKAAFKVDELVYQFMRIDVEDGLLSFKNNEADVNEKYSDEYIIGEAENRLDIAMDEMRVILATAWVEFAKVQRLPCEL